MFPTIALTNQRIRMNGAAGAHTIESCRAIAAGPWQHTEDTADRPVRHAVTHRG
jgi:hypothetical protein